MMAPDEEMGKKEKVMEEEERMLVDKMLEKFAADEEDEKMRQKIAIDSKEIFVSEAKRQRDERARMFQQEKQREMQERNASVEQEEYRQRVIAEARRKLLAQHAVQLKGFLPKVSIVLLYHEKYSSLCHIKSYLCFFALRFFSLFFQGTITNQDEAGLIDSNGIPK